MKKALSILKYILLGVSVFSVVTMAFLSAEESSNLMLIWAYILVGVAVAVTILLPAFNLIQNPSGAMRSLVGLAIVIVVAGICFALADGTTPIINSAGGFFEDPTELKLSDMGLYAAYLALGAAVVVSVVGEVWNSLK